MLQGSLVCNDLFAHRRVIFVQNLHDLFWLRGFGKCGEAAQIQINHRQLAAMSLQWVVGRAVDNQFRDLR